ncbi:MAG TPA: metallophosphoesterase [Candidatus Baltobacteraceae bacterium]|nr:metallophosphoesterase [Candidatus Baltobacteraceae bacterium]
MFRRQANAWCQSLLLGVVLLGLACTGRAGVATGHVLVLYTNDIHDHVLPGPDGVGGLPYVAGFIEAARAGHSDVLVLDAGDVTEKGDMVAFLTHSRITYEFMRRIGYDAVTIGNHDYKAGPDWLQRYQGYLGQPFLCLNLVRPDGARAFPPSKVFAVGRVRVGVVGLTVPADTGSLDFEGSGRALEQEARRLRPEADVIVALCHLGAKECARWSMLAPSVSVFVSGHTHEVLQQPVIVPETGAIIVQAGCYAEWVGRLDLTVDLDARKVVEAHGALVPMKHDAVPVDRDMLAEVRREAQALCPDAATVVAHTSAPIGEGVAWLAAEAMRRAAGTDIGFCHPGQILRSALPAGTVDVNALFLTGGQRGAETVRTVLSGSEITAYLQALTRQADDQTAWAGFTATLEKQPDGSSIISSDLIADRRYSVIMPKKEWETRFLRAAQHQRVRHVAGPLVARTFEASPSSVTFVGAMTSYVKGLVAANTPLEAEADRLMSERFHGRDRRALPLDSLE